MEKEGQEEEEEDGDDDDACPRWSNATSQTSNTAGRAVSSEVEA